jgi:hypothetical protein
MTVAITGLSALLLFSSLFIYVPPILNPVSLESIDKSVMNWISVSEILFLTLETGGYLALREPYVRG